MLRSRTAAMSKSVYYIALWAEVNPRRLVCAVSRRGVAVFKKILIYFVVVFIEFQARNIRPTLAPLLSVHDSERLKPYRSTVP